MGDPILQKAYDEAAAVFSQSFRFVEWKFVIAAKGTSTPFGDRDEPQGKATTKIDREKWVYVFRNNHEREVYAAIREEIRIDKSGKMAATPYDEIEKELKKRGDPVPLGNAMCLPRRIFGKPLVYRFFASRVRLPLAQIKELENQVTTFAPPVIFDPGKNLSVIEKDGELLVPVVDPVTVALHLHSAFVVAADDVIDYTAAHAGLSKTKRETVERRRKKHLLATLLKGIIGEESNTGANDLVHELKGMQGPLEAFLAHYEGEVQSRVDRRDRLGAFLVRWLSSEALKIAAAAYKGSPKDSWVRFLVPWCHAVTRLGETPPGRNYLVKLLDDKTHFIHTYVWPKDELSDDQFQSIRKGGMTVLEAWQTFAEARILIQGGNYVDDVVESLRKLRRFKQGQKLTTTSIKEIVAIDKTIKATKLIDPGPVETVRNFGSEPKAFGAIVESVNLLFAIRSTMDVMKGDDPRKKELAIIGLVGSSLDAASAVASLLKNTEKVVAVLGFVSGVIDVYLGHVEMTKAFKDGDQDIANGAFLTAAGATIGTAGTIMALVAIPGGQIVGVIGLAVVAIGFIYKWIKGKPPIQRFFNRCSWGKDHLLAGGGDWSPTRFEDWKGEKEFDHQLEALLNIICKVEISHGDTFRDLRYKMAWLPPNAKLVARYEETWKDEADNRTIEGEVVVTDKGPMSRNPGIAAYADGKNGVKLAIVPGQLSKKNPHMDIKVGDFRPPNPDLKKSVASGKLLVTFDGTANVTIPHKGWEKQTFYEA